MYELNLFKECLSERALSKKLARLCLVAYLFFGVVFLVLIGRTVLLNAAFVRDSRDIGALQKEIDIYRQKYAIGTLEKDWQAYAVQLRRVHQITQNRTSWAEAFREFAALLPPGVCVRTMTMNTENNAANLMLDVVILGRDKSGYQIADMLMNALKKSRLMSGEMRLLSQERTTVEGQSLEAVRIALMVPVK